MGFKGTFWIFLYLQQILSYTNEQGGLMAVLCTAPLTKVYIENNLCDNYCSNVIIFDYFFSNTNNFFKFRFFSVFRVVNFQQ